MGIFRAYADATPPWAFVWGPLRGWQAPGSRRWQMVQATHAASGACLGGSALGLVFTNIDNVEFEGSRGRSFRGVRWRGQVHTRRIVFLNF